MANPHQFRPMLLQSSFYLRESEDVAVTNGRDKSAQILKILEIGRMFGKGRDQEVQEIKKIVPQERVHQRFVEQFVDVPVPQIVEEIDVQSDFSNYLDLR